jgi:hypothetical protein
MGIVVILGLGMAGLLIGVLIHQAQAMVAVDTWQQVGGDGLGDPANKQIPSMAVFGDYLYAGTWNYDGISVTAQIMRTSTGDNWEMVDERPVNGAADMIAFDGAIYAGSWDGMIWSSTNGITWTEIITDGFEGSGNGIARFAIYSDTLYASTWGDGTEIWRTTDGTHWLPFVQDGLGDLNNSAAIASEIFDGSLYYGIVNGITGAQLWRTNGITTTAIITDGFGITENQAISSLALFQDILYAGTYNPQGVQVWRSINGVDWEPINFEFGNPLTNQENAMEVFDGQLYLAVANYTTGMEIWRTSNGTDWEQVGFAGFGDPNNHNPYWDNGMTIFKDRLYVGTSNWPTGGEVWRMTVDIYKTYLPLGLNNYPYLETGKIVFVSNRDGNDEIYSMNYDGSGVTRLTNNSSEDFSPDWSPDGSKIVFDSDRSGGYEIYVMSADGSNQQKITSMPDSYSPQWSPDGTRIAFVHDMGSGTIIFTMNPDGSDLFQVTDPAMYADSPCWSPDGSKIAFIGSLTTYGVYQVNVDGTDQSLLYASNGLASFAWSPDGTHLALTMWAEPNYNFDVYLYDIHSIKLTRLTQTTRNHLMVGWSPEGHDLIFSSNRDDLSNFEIYTMDLTGRIVENLTNNPAADAAPDWTK